MDAVVSVAPRKDLINQEHICQMDVDVNECQVTMSIQLQLNDSVVTPADTGAETEGEMLCILLLVPPPHYGFRSAVTVAFILFYVL